MEKSNWQKLVDLGIPLKLGWTGQRKTICPKCSHNRKAENQREACVSVNIDTGQYNCKNCSDFHGSVNFVDSNKKQYIRPQWTNATSLSDSLIQYFASRGISQQTLITAKIKEALEWMPQNNREEWTMQFPFIRDGEVINIKFRDANKNFKMVKDAERIFYNIDSIKDSEECVIVEGEMDALAFIEANYLSVVSVPNGASKGNNNLIYLDNCIEYFDNKKKIYIGVDNDENGRSLQKELIRRLGAERCWLIDYGDCKDGNEHLVKYGKFSLPMLIANAKGATIEGIIEINDMSSAIDDLYENGLPRGRLVNVKAIDEILSFPETAFIILTGIANHGKSPFLDYLIARLVVLYDLKCAYCSPESEPTSLHVANLISIITGKSFEKKYGFNNHLTVDEKNAAKKFMQEHYYFISEETEESYANHFMLDNFGVDQIFAYAKKLVLKYGINILVIDPWNTLDHKYGVGQDKLEYISASLDKFRKFAKRHSVTTILIAHPTKMPKELVKVKTDEGIQEKWMFKIPDLSNVADSNVFHTKPAIGLTYYRNNFEKKGTMIVNKMKHKHVGSYGEVDFVYDWVSGRFNVMGCAPDKKNWLYHKPLDQGYNEPANVMTAPPIIVGENNESNDLPF